MILLWPHLHEERGARIFYAAEMVVATYRWGNFSCWEFVMCGEMEGREMASGILDFS